VTSAAIMKNDQRKKIAGEEADVMVNKVEICGVNTAKLPVLTSEQMHELIKKSISTYTAVLPGMTIHPKKIIINRYFVSSHIYA
jgi:hypothetical protein